MTFLFVRNPQLKRDKKFKLNFQTIYNLNYFHILIPLLFSIYPIEFSFSQKANPDSTIFFQKVTELIQKKQYASAHLLIEDRIQKFGLNPFNVCLLVENGLKHYFRHDSFDIFYIRDHESSKQKAREGDTRKIIISRLRHPQRLLEKIIMDKPNNAFSHKLLGDYYDIQFKEMSKFEFIHKSKIHQLEENIFNYYSQAEKLGFEDPYVYRWLGEYYMNKKQFEMAEKYFNNSVNKEIEDPISYHRLAEVSYQKKLYTQAYNFAIKSLKYYRTEDIYLRYDALLLAAKSLKELGENNKFLKIINECIQTLPDKQEAYISLAGYYFERGKQNSAESIFRDMLFNNPYDLEGYRTFENYLMESKQYPYADSLFSELILNFENWDEAMANIYWSKGNLAFYQGLESEAKNFWEISRNYMQKYLPENHPTIKEVGEINLKNNRKN